MATPGRWTRVRIVACGVAFAGFSVWVGHRALELQVKKTDWLTDLAEDNYLREIEIPPRRGRILDRNGKELASTVEVDSVFCNPRVLAHVPDAPKRLAKALNMDVREVRTKLASKKYFVWLKRQVDPEESAAVRALDLPGVAMRREPRRFYPLRTLASTVIGHAGKDGKGLEGIELAYEQHLRGESATLQGIKDALGRELLIEGLSDTSAKAGKDLQLSIDSYLQLMTETVLHRTVEKHNAVGGTSVMMDPATGEVLAMASVPLYNPNDPKKGIESGARNRAVTDMYEPGSTFKTFTFAGALEAGKLRLTDLFDCQLGRLQIGNRHIKDDHPLAVASAFEVFQKSSNIGTVKIARRIGKEALADTIGRFGFGRRTRVGLPGESPGIVHRVEKWGEIHFANVAFGQGLTVTPLQITAAYAAIASGGVYHPPRLATRIVHPGGRVEPLPDERTERRVITSKTATTMLQLMEGVTQEKGTAKLAAIPGYRVGGKTGTAQKVANGRYAPGKYVSSFVGVVPVDKPRLVIMVMVDEPKPLHYGGLVAAPAFKEIAEAALKYLSVPADPALLAEAAEKAKKALPANAAAKGPNEVAEGPGSDAVLGEDEDLPVAAEGADALEEDELEGRSEEDVLAEKGMVPVPDFAGMSIGQVIRMARAAGIEVLPEGSGVAVDQSPPVRIVKKGASLRVTFRPAGEAGREEPQAVGRAKARG